MNKNDKSTLITFATTFTTVIILALLLQFVSAEIQTLPPVKMGTCVNLPQSYGNSTFQNISIVQYPNKSILNINSAMVNNGVGYFTYLFCNTTDYGHYIVNGIGDIDGALTTWQYDFQVTPSGADNVSAGQGIIIIAIIVIILIISAFFFILSFMVQNVAAKLGFIIFSAIGLLVAILYALLVVNEVLAQSPTLIQGLETFYTVLEILAGLSLTALMIFIGFFIYRSWEVKRGYRDE